MYTKQVLSIQDSSCTHNEIIKALINSILWSRIKRKIITNAITKIYFQTGSLGGFVWLLGFI